MNETRKKFGDPATRVREFGTWVVLLRPRQVTLGSLVLVSKERAAAFPSLSREAFAELREATRQLERALLRAFSYDKINYLMLMMVDPDVHFHVLPRYSRSRSFAGREFHDPGWPGPPDLSRVNETDDGLNGKILAHLRTAWD